MRADVGKKLRPTRETRSDKVGAGETPTRIYIFLDVQTRRERKRKRGKLGGANSENYTSIELEREGKL